MTEAHFCGYKWEIRARLDKTFHFEDCSEPFLEVTMPERFYHILCPLNPFFHRINPEDWNFVPTPDMFSTPDTKHWYNRQRFLHPRSKSFKNESSALKALGFGPGGIDQNQD